MNELSNKLSIVIITLNEEKYIWRLLENLKNQTFQNFEIIIIDSDSDDNTEEKALAYKSFFKEFRFLNMKKRWVSLWRNTWWKLSKYENILFLDADTLLENTFIERFLKEIKERNLDSATWQITAKKRTLLYDTGFLIMNTWMKITQYFSPTWVWACLFSKKKVFEEIWWFNERISLCEDCDFLNRSKKRWYNFWVLKEKFYFDFRRLHQEWLYKTYFKYLRANFHRFTKWELINDNRFDYNFWHYK